MGLSFIVRSFTAGINAQFRWRTSGICAGIVVLEAAAASLKLDAVHLDNRPLFAVRLDLARKTLALSCIVLRAGS